MSKRKLATIRRMGKLFPIKGKDRIELGTVDGWSVIIKKGEINEGDLFCFFEIDSFLPDTPMYNFLGKPTNHQNKTGHRIRTMKMSKCVSQGLALPLSFFEQDKNWNKNKHFKDGDDLTELLNVTKYDIDFDKSKNKLNKYKNINSVKLFPSFIPKTDQKRIENMPYAFELYKDKLFEETLKLDGSSCTIYRVSIKLPWYKKLGNLIATTILPLPILFSQKSKFGVCSRNVEITRPKTVENQSNFWDIALKHKLDYLLPEGYAIQGELLAPNIQENYEKVSEPEYRIFNVYDIKKRKYLLPGEAVEFIEKYIPNVKYVPIVNSEIKIFKECKTFEDFKKRVKGPSMNPEQKISEGRVYKAIDGSISFKSISTDYLLQKKK